MGWILAAFAALLLTLATGIWAGWMMRENHEDSRAVLDPARDGGGRGLAREPGPRPPLPFPGQFLLEIEDPDTPGDDRWHAEMITGADEVRAQLDAVLGQALRVIRGEAPGE